MKQNLYLLKFNNYYNRLVKGYDTIEEYEDYIIDSLANSNFIENDDIISSVTWNVNTSADIHFADYFIVCDSDGEIISRWFITELKKQCNGQYIIYLSRDVVYDYKNVILTAPCFIEKATLSADSPLIFNQEDFAANQIKQSEILLKDFSGCAWLIGYLSPSSGISDITVKTDMSVDTTSIGELTTWEYYPFATVKGHEGATAQNNFNNDFSVYFYAYDSRKSYPKVVFKVIIYVARGTYEIQSISNSEQIATYKTKAFSCPYDNARTRCIELAEQLAATLKMASASQGLLNAPGSLPALQGRKVETEDNKIYTVSVNSKPNETVDKAYTRGTTTEITVANAITSAFGSQSRTNPVYYKGTVTCYSLTLVPESSLSATFSLDIAKNYTNDTYRMICIPYPDEGKELTVRGAVDDNEEDIGPIRITREIALATAKAIMRKGGGTGSASTLVYDFQLLPYCPIANSKLWEIYEGDWQIVLEGDTPLGGHYTPVGNKCVVFEVAEPSFSFNIEYSITIKNAKVENQLDMYRLCSPNYAAIFEFNAARNGGVNYFNVDCTYKPYQPYIHINPNFGGLYGSDFNDPRGLICSGDFSLTSTSDAFITYALQNKNYESIFKRGIENMETVNKYARKQEIAQAVTGTFQGAASGATSGALMGGGWGAAAGAIIGGGAALAGGIADISINEALRGEALDYTKDLYGFNLENIKAMPTTLTNVSAFNLNNKIYPVLEFYSCTDRERVAFENKIKYNGMTVGVIDKIENYLQVEPTYIKGKIIRLEDLEANYHVANVIANEINKGVFI